MMIDRHMKREGKMMCGYRFVLLRFRQMCVDNEQILHNNIFACNLSRFNHVKCNTDTIYQQTHAQYCTKHGFAFRHFVRFETNTNQQLYTNVEAITIKQSIAIANKCVRKCITNWKWACAMCKWLHKWKYLLTSYVSTNAINPSGNAIANDTMAASSPSLDSSGDTSSNRDNGSRCPTAKSSRFFTTPWKLRKTNGFSKPFFKCEQIKK